MSILSIPSFLLNNNKTKRSLRFDILNNELRFSCRFKIVVKPAIFFFSFKSSLYVDTKHTQNVINRFEVNLLPVRGSSFQKGLNGSKYDTVCKYFHGIRGHQLGDMFHDMLHKRKVKNHQIL